VPSEQVPLAILYRKLRAANGKVEEHVIRQKIADLLEVRLYNYISYNNMIHSE